MRKKPAAKGLPALKQLTPVLIVAQVEECVASVVHDLPSAAKELDGHSVSLFITVDDLDVVVKALAGAPVVKAKHKTFYGSTEIYVKVKEPGGNTVGFAQFS